MRMFFRKRKKESVKEKETDKEKQMAKEKCANEREANNENVFVYEDESVVREREMGRILV